MTMKKLLAMLLAFVMLLSFAACSNATPNDGDKDPDLGEDEYIVGDEEWEDEDWEWEAPEHGEIPEGITVNEVDLTKFPADFSEWTAKNVMDYFEEAVDFPKDCEDWVQDHAEYWAGMPVYECAGIWNADGADDVIVLFTTFNPDSPDTTPEEVEEIKQIMRDDPNHDYTTNEIFLGPQDHLIGHVAFSYGFTTYNEDVYYQVEVAYNQLVESMGLTPDF